MAAGSEEGGELAQVEGAVAVGVELIEGLVRWATLPCKRRQHECEYGGAHGSRCETRACASVLGNSASRNFDGRVMLRG